MKTPNTSLLLLGAALSVGSVVAHDGATNGAPANLVPPAGPHSWAAYDANDDGAVTADEFNTAGATIAGELQTAFLAKYDSVATGATAGDGIITTAEAKAVFDAQAADWLTHVLDTYDTNNDGAITDADTAPTHGPRGLRHLDAYDANDDGDLSSAELAAAAAEMAEIRLARFLEKYDGVPTGATAGDGVITGAESLAVFQDNVADRIAAILERYDANDDGAVSADEIAAIENRTGKGKGPGGRGRR